MAPIFSRFIFPWLITPFFLIYGLPASAVIDAHVHAFSDKSWDEPIGADKIIAELDANGIQNAIIISAGYFQGWWSFWLPWFRSYEKVKEENDFVAKITHQYPHRFLGACGVHPFDRWAVSELHRCSNDLGFRVVKIHPNAQRINVSNPRDQVALKNFLDEVGNLRMVALVHAYGKTLEFQKAVYHLAGEVPNVTFVFAHMFGEHSYSIAKYIESGKLPSYPNVFVDVSGSIMEEKDSEKLAWALRTIGLKRVLFGSDYPVYTPKATLERLQKLLFRNELETILSNKGPFNFMTDRGRRYASDTN